MHLSIEFHKVQRYTDEEIRAIAACEDIETAEEQFEDMEATPGIHMDFERKRNMVTQRLYNKFNRIVYLRTSRADIERIKRDYKIPDDIELFSNGMDEYDSDKYVRFSKIDHKHNVVGYLNIPIETYVAEGYEIHPAEPYYVHKDESIPFIRECTAGFDAHYYNLLKYITEKYGEMEGSFITAPCDEYILSEIRCMQPDAAPDFESWTEESDFIYTITLVKFG